MDEDKAGAGTDLAAAAQQIAKLSDGLVEWRIRVHDSLIPAIRAFGEWFDQLPPREKARLLGPTRPRRGYRRNHPQRRKHKH